MKKFRIKLKINFQKNFKVNIKQAKLSISMIFSTKKNQTKKINMNFNMLLEYFHHIDKKAREGPEDLYQTWSH